MLKYFAWMKKKKKSWKNKESHTNNVPPLTNIWIEKMWYMYSLCIDCWQNIDTIQRLGIEHRSDVLSSVLPSECLVRWHYGFLDRGKHWFTLDSGKCCGGCTLGGTLHCGWWMADGRQHIVQKWTMSGCVRWDRWYSTILLNTNIILKKIYKNVKTKL